MVHRLRVLWRLFKAGLVLMAGGTMIMIGLGMLYVLLTNPGGELVLMHFRGFNEWYVEWILYILSGIVLLEDFIRRVKKK